MINVVYYVSLETDLARLIISKRLWPIMTIPACQLNISGRKSVLMSYNDILITHNGFRSHRLCKLYA